jgi:hypothetical protein
MTARNFVLPIVLTIVLASAGYSQTATARQDREQPDFSLHVWGYIVEDFSARVAAYSELRSEIEKGLPPLRSTDNPAEIRNAVRALAKRIRAARARTREGDIFTPPISDELRKILALETNADTVTAVEDGNPGAFSYRINSSYPEGKPLSSVPANILAALPALPDDIQYRFVGGNLILLDVRAGVILDRIPDAIDMKDCRKAVSEK